MRTPVFELHIRPMFRLLDRDHMAFKLDLYDYDQVVRHADDIRDWLDRMPTAATGGPWPPEWVALFARWSDEANPNRYKRLEFGRATYSITVSPARATLRANGTLPAAGYRVWLGIEAETPLERSYALWLEAPDQTVTGLPASFAVKDYFDRTDTRQIFVRDMDGLHQVPRPT